MVEKRVILDVLKKSIHELLISNELIDLVGIEDSVHTQNLCSAIEALFIHGQIKNQSFNLLSKFGRNKHSYEYDFWNFVQNFIPKNLINVLKMNDVKLTNIGLGRVWLRIALNECTILSYLDSIRSDVKKLQYYYTKDALIRDDEMMEMFRGLLTSIERIPFNLNTNNSLLNTWINSDALKIAGCEVNTPFRIENSNRCNLLEDESLMTDDFQSLSNAPVSEDQNLTSVFFPSHRYSNSVPSKDNMIFTQLVPNDSLISVYKEINTLSNDKNHNSNEFEENISIEDKNSEEYNPSISNNSFDGQEIMQDIDESESLSYNEDLVSTHTGENLNEFYLNEINFKGNESEIVKDTVSHPNDVISENDQLPKTELSNPTMNISDESYDQLWSKHSLVAQKSIESIRTTDSVECLIQNGSEKNQIDYSPSSSINSLHSKVFSFFASRYFTPASDFIYNLFIRRFNFLILRVKESDQSWELIGDELLANTLEMKRLVDIFPGVNLCSTNNGVNSVFGGMCSKCTKPLESGKALIDHYDGNLFCTNCENGSKSVIPRNVIYNWDFEKKFVSETTKRFLSEMMSHPNINLAEHPNLFEVIPELARVQMLRRKLNLLWLQVTSCDIQTSTKVRETMFPREYMLTNVNENDLYSLEDLIILQSGVLEKTLLFVINKIAIPHVKKCLMCRMKAMPCDKCLDEKRVIYIHEIDEYLECSAQLCKSVIHKNCKNSSSASFYCRRCVQYLENQQPITLAGYDTANYD